MKEYPKINLRKGMMAMVDRKADEKYLAEKSFEKPFTKFKLKRRDKEGF